MKSIEIAKGSNHSLFEVSDIQGKAYDLPQKVIRAVERGTDPSVESPFEHIPWDCCEGFMVLGSKETCTNLFNSLTDLMKSCLDDELILDSFDPTGMPLNMVLMEPSSPNGVYAIAAIGYVEDLFDSAVTDLLDQYQATNGIWWSLLGGQANDDDPVNACMSAVMDETVKPNTPQYDLLVAFMSDAIKDPMYEGDEEWLEYYNIEELDDIRQDIENYRKNG